MTDIENDDFLKKYHIDLPNLSSLAVLHAEPVSFIHEVGYTLSDEALKFIGDLVAPSGLTAAEFMRWSALGDSPKHYQILFFLDGGYQMAHHIWSIRDTWHEIAMATYLGPSACGNVIDNPPPIGLLYVSDAQILTDLAQRSPFMGQLLPIADGPPDDAIWVYFLAAAEQVEIEVSEKAEAPKEKHITQLIDIGLTGEQS
jgi:hypothetical protein